MKKFKAYATKGLPGTASLSSPLLYQQIKASKKKNKKAIHIAFIHWGKNYSSEVSKKQSKVTKALLGAGVDLIIGHGAHLLQPAKKIGKKWVFYNIGNFVFPSPGRYKKKKAQPYSLILSLNKNIIRAYPIFSNNKMSKYQSHFIKPKELPKLKRLAFPSVKTKIKSGTDKYGPYLEISL